mgnify:CR=1 FL=1
MIRRPPRSTLDRSSAASDVYKRQKENEGHEQHPDRRHDELDPGEQSQHHARCDRPLAVGHSECYQAQRGSRQVGEASDVAAVSYTHLRAHETVLDLVCRLLLEKKK